MSALGYSEIKRKNELISTNISSIAELIGEKKKNEQDFGNGIRVQSGLGLKNDSKTLKDLSKSVSQGIFKMMVAGSFSNGKSTMLNAMMGEKFLPMKNLTCTSIVTMISYGVSDKVYIYQTNKEEPRELSLEEFKREFALTTEDRQTLEGGVRPDRFKNIAYSGIECEIDFLSNGVRLLDTPGIEDEESRTTMVKSFLSQSHAVIYILDGYKLLSYGERNFLIDFLSKDKREKGTTFFVVNKFDLVDDDDKKETIDTVHHTLASLFTYDGKFDQKLYDKRVFFVSAKKALKAREGDKINKNLLEESNFDKFEKELEIFLTSDEKYLSSIGSTIKSVKNSVINAIKETTRLKNQIGKDLDELERNRKMSEEKLLQLEKQKTNIERTINSYCKVIIEKANANLASFIQQMYDNLQADAETDEHLIRALNQMGFKNTIVAAFKKSARENMSNEIAKEIEKYVKNKFNIWSSNVLPLVIENDFEILMQEIENEVADFNEKLEEAKSIFSSGFSNDVLVDYKINQLNTNQIIQLILGVLTADPSQITGTIMGDGSWKVFITRLVIDQGIWMVLAGVLGPIGWVGYLGAEIFHFVTQKNKKKEEFLKTINEKIHDALIQNLPKMQNDLKESFESEFNQLSSSATLTLQSLIDETRANQEEIINNKKQKTFSINKETKRLNFIEEAVFYKFNEMYETVYGKKILKNSLVK